MKIYLVGGAVRDTLLGRPVKDRDWVVVGADAETLLKQGFEPVGKDFPVFLHPTSHEEYALARTERKIAQGYTGFSFYADKSVTLEQDLLRRDLTINAMAQDESGKIIDPFGGQSDLKNKILRHVSPAFSEDPVRILRVARFAARYHFQIAPETQQLMRDMVANGEVSALVPERVWQELSKGLMENFPLKMIDVLAECGALSILLPEYAKPMQPENALTFATQENHTLPERYAILLQIITSDLTKIQNINKRFRVPKQCAELAELVCQNQAVFLQHNQINPNNQSDKIIQILKKMDAFRRPERFNSALNVFHALLLGKSDGLIPTWQAHLTAAQNVPTHEIAQQYANQAQKIAEAIDQARAQAVKNASGSLNV